MNNDLKYQTALPAGWALIDFPESCEKISLNGIKIKQKQYLPTGRYPVVDQGQEIIGGYFEDERLIVPSEPPYIIFGDHTMVKKYINFRFIAGADGVKVLKPYTFFNGKLYFYFLHCIKLPDKGYARHLQFLEKADIPLPPLKEQHRIVAKIEELLSSLDKGIESLKTAQQQLKVYRQAVLKCAFEGRLTNKDVKEGELPKGWKWEKIGFFLPDNKKGVSTGPFGTMLKKSEHQDNGVPVLGIENIGEGVFQMPNKIFITREKATELKSFGVKANDIIISRSGTVGEICIVPEKMEGSIISTNLIKVSLDQKVMNPKYFVYLFQGGKVRQQVFDLCKGSSRAFLNQTILKFLDFPYCPIHEQETIVAEIESRLSICDKIEESIAHSLKQSESMRQSILKKAFEGRLVPQDPNDEPASVLLERIRRERAETPAVKAKKPRRKGDK